MTENFGLLSMKERKTEHHVGGLRPTCGCSPRSTNPGCYDTGMETGYAGALAAEGASLAPYPLPLFCGGDI